MTGYIFNFKEHGAFAPDGKVAEAMPQAEIDAHNRKLAQEQIEAMKQTGRAVLYCAKQGARLGVGTWEGSIFFPASCVSDGKHNLAGKQRHFWFNFDGSVWHGVNIGDNDIVRCKRTKGGAK